ncbi:MAG: cupin domain-containing protein [Bacteroidetes bacterium]|nr:cupin domain-containing protein [Bacteroidota bacterium]
MPQYIKEIKRKELVPGITGYYAHGESMTFGYVELKKATSIPRHSHVQEQITYVLEGELEMTVGGQPCLLTAGMYYVMGSGVPHSAVAKTDCRVIDAFSPVREDYKNQ